MKHAGASYVRWGGGFPTVVRWLVFLFGTVAACAPIMHTRSIQGITLASAGTPKREPATFHVCRSTEPGVPLVQLRAMNRRTLRATALLARNGVDLGVQSSDNYVLMRCVSDGLLESLLAREYDNMRLLAARYRVLGQTTRCEEWSQRSADLIWKNAQMLDELSAKFHETPGVTPYSEALVSVEMPPLSCR